MNVVSLLPSTTEIISELGYQNMLVGRSHECDLPEGIETLPVCTQPAFESDGSSAEVNERITNLIEMGLSVYRVDGEQLKHLQPDVILTQDQCDACAASFSDVEEAVTQKLEKDVNIVSVSPSNLQEVCDSFRQIGAAVGDYFGGAELADHTLKKLKSLQNIIKVQEDEYPAIACIEWLDPLMSAGNWIPELAEYACCHSPLGKSGEHSPVISWENLVAADPDIIVIFPCGYSINQTLNEMNLLTEQEDWESLTAVQNKEVYIADGNHYFNRPGPRLLDSVHILAEIAHPEYTGDRFKGRGWINYVQH